VDRGPRPAQPGATRRGRSPDGRFRTTPLRGLWTHPARGFYHDGRFATLRDVVDHHDGLLSLGLGAAEKADLAEHLKSL
jgi:cytochrome c peroxidase